MERKQHVDDGRKTMKQEIEHLRANNPDKLAPYGEWADNSVDWGKATHGAMVLAESRTVIIDNGEFDKDVFPKTFSMRKEGTEERYNTENDWNKLGRFNAGSTESVLLLASKATLMHNFGGTIMKTTLDLDRCIRDNNIAANSATCTTDEIEDFDEYQHLIDPAYNIADTSLGTVLIVEGLRTPNTHQTFNNIKRFMYGLYSPARENPITWHLFNWITNAWPTNLTPTDSITPNNLSFGNASPTNNEIFVYPTNNEQKKSYTESLDPHVMPLYSFKIETKFLNTKQARLEKQLYGNTTDIERVGFQVRRAGRLVSGIIPLKWGLSTGMNRARGLRITINIPAGIEPDNDWCIGTFKKITNDTWGHFNDELQSFITDLFKDINKMHEKAIKDRNKIFINSYNKKYAEIDSSWDSEKITTHLEAAKTELEYQLTTKETFSKKNGNSYNAITKYITKLQEMQTSETDSDTELSESKTEALLLEQEIAAQLEEEANQASSPPESSKERIDLEDMEESLSRSQPKKNCVVVTPEGAASDFHEHQAMQSAIASDLEQNMEPTQPCDEFTRWHQTLSERDIHDILHNHWKSL
jgi:hypothetical protein